MKKALAILLTLAMLFTALSANVFAEETVKPTIIVTGSEDVDEGSSTTIKVSLSNFADVKGMDLSINSGDGVVFTAVESSILTEDNYTKADHKIRIVDLISVDAADINITATVNADAQVWVEAELAKSGTEVFGADVSITDGNVTVKQVTVDGTISGTEEEPVILKNEDNGYFIPYGSVYTFDAETNKYNFIAKEDDGSFIINQADVFWKKFKIPTSGFGTFGVAKTSLKSGTPAIMFGTYSNKLGSVDHGTMIIAGDWTELKAKFSSKTEAELVEFMSNVYDSNIADNDYVTANFNSGANSVRIYKKAQYNWMWKDLENNILEYAFRISGVSTGDEYVGVGYYTENETVTYSSDVRVFNY